MKLIHDEQCFKLSIEESSNSSSFSLKQVIFRISNASE